MALRDKLAERVQPHLEPGEQIQAVFLAQSGVSPYWAFLSYLITAWAKYWIVVVTDRAVLVLRAGVWSPTKPKEVTARLPRATRFGAPGGLWHKIQVGDIQMWVHKRFHKDVEEADRLAPAP